MENVQRKDVRLLESHCAKISVLQKHAKVTVSGGSSVAPLMKNAERVFAQKYKLVRINAPKMPGNARQKGKAFKYASAKIMAVQIGGQLHIAQVRKLANLAFANWYIQTVNRIKIVGQVSIALQLINFVKNCLRLLPFLLPVQ